MSRGFLYAYVTFLTTDVCLLLLSSQHSPEQFPHFQAKKAVITRRLEDSGALDDIEASVRNHSQWRPHRDLPLLLHFIYKNELTGECAEPALGFPFEDADFHMCLQLLNQYATVHHLLFPSPEDPHLRASQVLGERLSSLQEDPAARMVFERSDSGLFVGMSSTDYRLLVWFDSLVTISDAQKQIQVCLIEFATMKSSCALVSSFSVVSFRPSIRLEDGLELLEARDGYMVAISKSRGWSSVAIDCHGSNMKYSAIRGNISSEGVVIRRYKHNLP